MGFLHLERELRVVEDAGMFYCVLVSINIPFESLDRILFHIHFKQKHLALVFGICLLFLLTVRSLMCHLF